MVKSLNQNEYFYKLENLDFNQEYLANFVKNEISPENWYVFDCGKIRWTVQEDYGTVRKECTAFRRSDWFQELYSLFNIKINFGDVLFTMTPPPGIPPHVDRNRSVALNLPVIGNFKKSPILWYKDFDKSTEAIRFYHSELSKVTNKPTALLFNPKKIHGVINEEDYNRCLLTIWWRNISYEKFLCGWQDGSLINWGAAKKNKFIKIIKD